MSLTLRSAVAAVFLVTPVVAGANRYTLLDLGANYIPLQINASGNIAGALLTDSGYLQAQVHRGEGWRPLHPNRGGSRANALNVEGDAVGSQNSVAMIWRRGERGKPLVVPPSAHTSFATGISSNRIVVGTFITAEGGGGCFRTDSGGVSIDLGTPGMGDFCEAAGINRRGWITGDANHVNAGNPRAFLWKDDTFHDLGALSALPSYSVGLALNQYGHVVGCSAGEDGELHAFLWNGNRMQDIGDAGNYPDGTCAWAISDHGEIVGVGETTGQVYHAVRFAGGLVIPLAEEVENLGDWQLETATSVNGDGVIVGTGWLGGDVQAFLLTPKLGQAKQAR